MNSLARGYIASGEFNGYRIPQHLQNQIVKAYCDANHLKFVLSRAEYWINGSTMCQLWAALKEDYKHIVFFSLWQLPNEYIERLRIYQYCSKNNKILHFSTERIYTDLSKESLEDLEILIGTNLMVLSRPDNNNYLNLLEALL